MAGTVRPGRSPPLGTKALAQRRYWDRVYAADPHVFGRRSSPLARWALARLGGRGGGRSLVELGCGTGRDSAYFARQGFRVLAVDVAPRATDATARRLGRGARGSDAFGAVETDDARHALGAIPPGTVDVVYSCLFLNMDFDRRDHVALGRAVRAVLAPNGRHVYSVRAVDDPWYGRGRRLGPDRYRLGPRGPTVHFFSPEYARSLGTSTGFVTETLEPRSEGGRAFPIRVLYVLDRVRGAGPIDPGANATSDARPTGLPSGRTPR